MSNTFQRPRRTSRWDFAREYESIESFLKLPIGDGLHTISYKGRKLDFLIRNRYANTTLLVFHGALSPRQRTIPYLQGDGISSSAGVNLIACADPVLDRGAIACGWFLGDNQLGPLIDLFKPILEHCIQELQSSQILLFGGSGGGYAAVNFGSTIPGSTVIAMNPRLDLDSRPKSTLPDYLDICHGANTKTPMQRIKRDFFTPNLAEKYRAGLNFDLLILQNKNDSRFLNHQVKPFLQGLPSHDRTWISLFDGDPGHSPVPREEIARRIRIVSDPSTPEVQQRYADAGFSEVNSQLTALALDSSATAPSVSSTQQESGEE